MELRQVIYLSTCTAPSVQDQIQPILHVSRRNNRMAGITGMLLTAAHGFFQVLEGPPDAVDETLQRIEHDNRHKNLITLIDRAIEERTFSDWTMAWAEIPDDHPLLGEVKTLNLVDSTIQRSHAIDKVLRVLLESFIRTNTGVRDTGT